ncbi:hypothetical protein ACFOD4_07925 [Pseudoroseomonas globiformis]|uniref:Phage holin family protein n=1 Tax=Teichococcus globiformis TaxID=2307229 RepID=A0ABV7FX73_9PROT
MRAFRLAAASLEAERVLLGLRARRTALRVAFGVIAAIFVCATLAMAHLLAWIWLADWAPLHRALLLFGVDLGLALILGLLAMRDTPGPQEIEARVLRDTAFTQARSSLSVLPILGAAISSPLMGTALALFRRRR